jgi:AcrR family transcriptional regulator
MAKDKAIAAAVFQVLAEVGYQGLTMDEVAMTAGVGKAAIYRRWRSKEDLMVGFLAVAGEGLVVAADTGSLRGDLLAFMTSTADVLADTAGRATRAVIGATANEPGIADAYRRGPLPHWDGALRQILDRAAQRGEVSPDAMDSVAAHAGGSIFLQFWYLRGYDRLDETIVTAVVDEVMIPLLAIRETAQRTKRTHRLPPTADNVGQVV